MQPGDVATFMAQLSDLPTIIYQIGRQAEHYTGQLQTLRREANETLDVLDRLEARLHGANLLADRLTELRREST